MMCDSNLLVKVSGGIDIVAIEAEYHLIVLFFMYHNQVVFLSKLEHGQLLSW